MNDMFSTLISRFNSDPIGQTAAYITILGFVLYPSIRLLTPKSKINSDPILVCFVGGILLGAFMATLVSNFQANSWNASGSYLLGLMAVYVSSLSLFPKGDNRLVGGVALWVAYHTFILGSTTEFSRIVYITAGLSLAFQLFVLIAISASPAPRVKLKDSNKT